MAYFCVVHFISALEEKAKNEGKPRENLMGFHVRLPFERYESVGEAKLEWK